MPKRTGKKSEYRKAAAVVIFNPEGQVWLGQRAGHSGKYSWQFPQGGMDPGETPEHAAIRELHEETGISVHMVSPLGEIEKWLYYDLPTTARKGRMNRWRGQRQRWFAFRFLGDDGDINLKYELPPEFSDWRWAELNEAAKLIVPFKRKVYERVERDFARFSGSHND